MKEPTGLPCCTFTQLRLPSLRYPGRHVLAGPDSTSAINGTPTPPTGAQQMAEHVRGRGSGPRHAMLG